MSRPRNSFGSEPKDHVIVAVIGVALIMSIFDAAMYFQGDLDTDPVWLTVLFIVVLAPVVGMLSWITAVFRGRV